MCGIAFVINNDTYCTNTDDFMRDAMLANQVRGVDSAGLFQLDRAGDVTLHKAGTNASNFLIGTTTKTMIRTIPSTRVTVGHVRAATMGSISSANAHPFQIQREDGTEVVGVHNGTLSNWRNKPEADQFDVDSEWAFHMIAKHGEKAFEYFDGAFAFIWYDSTYPDSMFMARNKERPLHYMVDYWGRSILGCSELGMLRWIADRNSFKLDERSQHKTAYYLEEGKIYEFDLKKIGNVSVTSYPAHDPKTSVVAPVISHPMIVRSQHSGHGQRQSYLSDDYYGDEDYSDYAAAWGTSLVDYDLVDQEETLKGVKDAIRLARVDEYKKLARQDDDESPIESGPIGPGDSLLVDAEELEQAMTRAINEHMRGVDESVDTVPWSAPKVESSFNGGTFLYTVEGKSSTEEERKAAKDAGMYGMVVSFNGIDHDDDLSVCLGSFAIQKPGQAKENYEGEIRFIPGKVARDLYIDRDSPAVVVGLNTTAQWLILERLTPAQSQTINNLHNLETAQRH
jgi:predicted glutamine amidotransferase